MDAPGAHAQIRLCQKSVRVQFSTLKIRTIRTKSETMAALVQCEPALTLFTVHCGALYASDIHV